MAQNLLLSKIKDKFRFLRKISMTYQVLIPLVFIAIIVLSTGSKSIFSSQEEAVKVIAIVSIIISALFIIIFNTFIKRPLKKIISVIDLLSEGDFTKRVKTNASGEIKEIEVNLNNMIDKLSEFIVTIMKNSSLLASSSEEFSATSKENVKGAGEQTDKIDQAFQSIQVFHEAIDGIFTNTESAENETTEATSAANTGQEIILKTIQNMENTSQSVSNAANKVNELGENSKQIGNITAVIREITNKTNLLALNAAIEAARAGEHGLGFAVVADEVRKLAERTTKATKEIEETIKNIQDATEVVVELMETTTNEVGQSTGLVQEAGASLKQIHMKINHVSDEIKSIVTSLDIQRESTNGVVNDMERVSNVAQGFTISAMETSKASNELSKLASELESTVHNFKVNIAEINNAD